MENVLELTRRMFESAQAGDWQALVDLEMERRGVLAQALDGSADSASQPPDHLIQQVLDADLATMALVEAQRAAVANQLRELTCGRKARSAYTENGP